MDGDKPESSSSSDGSSSSSSEESGSSDSEEANGKKPGSDEAASDPASCSDEGAQPSAAPPRPPAREKPPERQAPPAKPERHTKKPKRHREALPEFELTVDTLQGRWRHSVSSMGMLTVRGSTVQFDMGNVYELEEIVPGRIEMRGWQTVQQRSCAEEIVWMNRERTQEVRWMLEEDADQPPLLDGLDKRNIIKGKRKRNKVDYRAVEREIEAEERRHKDVFSDGSNESQGEEATETMTPKEWSALHASQCAKATKLFHQWMLSTCTPRHEEVLKRKGKLLTRLPVSLVGPGQLMLKKGLQSYGIALHFHSQETTVVVDAAARQRYQERHSAEWQAARVKLATRAQAATALREGQAPLKPPLAETPAAEEPGAATTGPLPKRKRLRRIVDSDDEAPAHSASQADEAAAGEPMESIGQPQNGTATAAPETPSEVAPTETAMAMPTEDVAKPVAEEAEMPLEKVVEKVKMELEATPPPSAAKALELLSFLETQRVSPEIMLSTKIGVTVTGMRKTYAGHPTLALRAKQLVQRWKNEYFDKEKGFRT